MTEQINNKNIHEKLINRYIDDLQKGEIPWIKPWKVVRDFNPVTNIKYSGMNALKLDFIRETLNLKDPRWVTFKQAEKQGWKVKSRKELGDLPILGVPLEYAVPLLQTKDKKKKWLTWPEFYAINNNLDKAKEELGDFKLSIHKKTFYVFNGEHIDGIEPFIKNQPKEFKHEQLINDTIQALGVRYQEFGNQAYYNLKDDEVVTPKKDFFLSEQDYYATVLHELSHSTGHPDRLNRDMSGKFGSIEYAKEELRAEIGSSFLSETLNLPMSETLVQNHSSYINSWIKILQDDPNQLDLACKGAERIEKYILDKIDWEHKKEIYQCQPSQETRPLEKEQKVNFLSKSFKEKVQLAKGKSGKQIDKKIPNKQLER